MENAAPTPPRKPNRRTPEEWEAIRLRREAGETVEVTGKLVRKTFPGPPGFGESPNDKPIAGYFLELTTPICTEEDEFDAAKSAVSLVQLVVGKNARYTPFLGQRITMRGTWYHAHTGYHNAEVVLEPVGQPRVERR